jgi:V8-like Glu-specific endopeptidase
VCIVALCLLACAPQAIDPIGSASAPIVDGSRSHNRPVVFLYNVAGAACTATLVAPRAVLTAKHCVQGGSSSAAPASQFIVYVGDSPYRPIQQYRVAEVRPAPGCWNLCGDASDVAMLILTTRADETPLEISFEHPGTLTGQNITAIGYGQTPSGGSGTQLETRKRVTGASGGIVYVEPSVCSGDSGGPLLGPDGRIYGVASFIYSPDGSTRPTCGTAPGAYNGISHLQEFIEGVIEESGTCVPGDEEICNGEDDDCDEAVDEVCTPIGEGCGVSEECVGVLCGDTSAGRICTQVCDPLRPGLGCPPGLYCDNSGGCDGRCVPLGAEEPGTLGYDADCTADHECASLFCVDPGDGRRRCLDPCRGDAGLCLSGEACAATPGACGACVPAAIVRGERGIGEPCSTDEECGSRKCFDDGGVSYCSRECMDDEACGEGFHCRAAAMACVRGPRGAVGSGCVENADCGDGNLCAARGDVRWCTAFCEGDCPTGFDCVPVGDSMVCSPGAALVGEACTVAEDCLSGLCVDTPAGRTCTRLCDAMAPCETGLECVRTADGRTNVCALPIPPPPVDDGGCSVGETTGRTGRLAWLLATLAVVLLISRRRR